MRDPNDFQTIDMFEKDLPGEIRFLLEVKLPDILDICHHYRISYESLEEYRDVQSRLVALGYITEEQRHAC